MGKFTSSISPLKCTPRAPILLLPLRCQETTVLFQVRPVCSSRTQNLGIGGLSC